MDPLSLAGLGIGVASLAFELFAGCIKGFVLLSTAHNLGKDRSTWIRMLNLQEVQLTEWARCAGLLAAECALDKRLNETVVHATLKELRELLLDTDKLKTRHKLGLVANPSMRREDADENGSPAARGVLSHAISDDLRRDILFRARLIQSKNSFPRRLWWAAVDKSKFEELIDRVKSFIRELWYLLDPVRQGDVTQSLKMILSHVIGMSGQIDELAALRETMLASSSPTDPWTSHSGSMPLASAAEIKAIQIDTGALTVGEEHASAKLLTVEHVGQVFKFTVADLNIDEIKQYKPMKNDTQMGLAIYNNEPIFIEWKQLSTQFRSKILHRVESLALLLATPKHPDFRSLQCEGLARDNNGRKVAFIYRTPPTVGLRMPKSLRSLFGMSPSVTERIQLALQITQSVKYFHTAGWLHKNLRSENILFWDSESSTLGSPPILAPVISDPYLVGFAFSRQDSLSEISEQPSSDPQRDIYRHPEALGEPSESFSAAKDIYALGTILLEIGEWRSLRSLVEKVVDVSKPDVPLEQLAKVRLFLLDDGPKGGLAMLKFRMGEIYAEVTKMMLSGEMPLEPETRKGAGIMFSPDLLAIAIHELARCIV